MIESGLNDYLLDAFRLGASDLHLTVGVPPSVRVSGRIRHLEAYPPLTQAKTRDLVYGILTDKQRKRLEEELELDFSYAVPNLARFRVNVYVQKGALGAALRTIPHEITPIEDLGLPKVVSELADRPRGLVLVTGPTGSGKSTTLAAMIDRINTTREKHIMSVEDPVEFLHTHKKCLVNQREVGSDTRSFASALKHVLRQDPDVILVGEMRDLETISLAVTAAETGHMVFATLHTQDAPQTVDRIIDVFPPHQQQQIRAQLANALQGVVTQMLVSRREDRGGGRVVASEVLVATPGVRNLIREGKNHQLYSAMQTGSQYGMQTMDSSLADLVRRGEVSRENALKGSSNPDEVSRLLGLRGSERLGAPDRNGMQTAGGFSRGRR
ncbi:twitching motility protein [Rubrobacter radiotolerans]|uniref:Twitching motility protein n=1 Tax=Rubrobacter radiotolerans TaxID=42256 RepID=A0A023X112_RUBRA|nr:type IV pilus twitching motility protein PilT [Rubrobacter radiotolerans]AHY46147.1 twitching motility protein [Rubrobacter radiotolerans]MDX5893557.1 type IV pilus twitching motility protein PilT [Rubrobacter radiotolerans]SMC03976.1 twitching motility protein PilT [Rubrobacter radiotolerans DSM 5868]